MSDNKHLNDAVNLIMESSRTTAFTGAGISVESGVPAFRGHEGLWDKYNPDAIEISHFIKNPESSWRIIKEIFYDFFGKVKPNGAHYALAELEKMGFLHSIITQNIDNLHHDAGSIEIYEFHGNSRELVCTGCGAKESSEDLDLSELPPFCKKCNYVLKPDFVFFGEQVPGDASSKSWAEAINSELFLIIGTSGEVMPASMIPFEAKKRGKKIIEINVTPSKYTGSITDVFLEGKASLVMDKILKSIRKIKSIE